MDQLTDVYDTRQEVTENEILYLFISRGRKNVIKLVQYVLANTLFGRDVYNLGFGDYDFEKDHVKDDIETNNGDVYKVFQTVLNTIPAFFTERPFL